MQLSEKATIGSKILAVLDGLRAQSPVWHAHKATVSADARLQGRGSAPGEEIIALTGDGVQLWSKQGFTKDQHTYTSHGAMDWSARIKARRKQGPVGDTGGGGGMAAAGT